MSTKSILIDSNIIVYALNLGSPKHAPAQAFLLANVGRLVLAQQNICESFRVLTHPKFPNPMSPLQAIKAIDAIAEVSQVITPDETTHHLAFALVQKHKLSGDKIFDAYLAATAISAGVSIIATDNTKDFAALEHITLLNPFS